METLPERADPRSSTWTLIRDAAVLQCKLVVDGMRDLLLVPTSLVAALFSLLRTRNGVPGSEFYSVVSLGKQSERWINLFGALRNAPPEIQQENQLGNMDFDDIVSRVETFVVDEYQRGGMTRQARDRMEQAISKMRRRPTTPP